MVMKVKETKSLWLPRLLSDGAVLEHKKPIHIWGFDAPGRVVTVSFDHWEKTTEVSDAGRFDLDFPVHPAGGPYELKVTDDAGECIVVRDLMVGAVWYCSGQSNMDLMMERVRDSYPDILAHCTDDGIRNFKIETSVNYHGPLEEYESGEWKKAEPNHILSFSATAYFFARKLREKTGLTVGIVHASLGGSRIQGWLSREMLAGYDELLKEAECYGNDVFLESQIRKNEMEAEAWHRKLDECDEGLRNHWEEGFSKDSGRGIQLPVIFEDTELKGFTGSLWFQKRFTVPKEMAGRPAHLWMGTMVDSDTMFVNGIKVGETGYQYPPRKYRIPEGVLHEGENCLVVRLIVENGKGRWTPGKGYFLFNEQGVVNLQGEWTYRIGAESATIPETDFVNWKATGLFNAMCAPCTNFPIEGIVWYQGESNTELPWDYLDLTKRQIEGYRKLWKDENLPYLYVQLPNFTEDLRDVPEAWPALRECQRKAAALPHTGMIVSIDLGEDNDLHPHGKRNIGERLAAQALHMVYGGDEEYTGPIPVDYCIEDECNGEDDRNGSRIRIRLSHAEGIYVRSFDKGRDLVDFTVVSKDGETVTPEAVLRDGEIQLHTTLSENAICEIRYLYENTNRGGLIYNSSDYPMGPFVLK